MKQYVLHLSPSKIGWELHVAGKRRRLLDFYCLDIARRDSLRLANLNSNDLFIHDDEGNVMEHHSKDSDGEYCCQTWS